MKTLEPRFVPISFEWHIWPLPLALFFSTQSTLFFLSVISALVFSLFFPVPSLSVHTLSAFQAKINVESINIHNSACITNDKIEWVAWYISSELEFEAFFTSYTATVDFCSPSRYPCNLFFVSLYTLTRSDIHLVLLRFFFCLLPENWMDGSFSCTGFVLCWLCCIYTFSIFFC